MQEEQENKEIQPGDGEQKMQEAQESSAEEMQEKYDPSGINNRIIKGKKKSAAPLIIGLILVLLLVIAANAALVYYFFFGYAEESYDADFYEHLNDPVPEDEIYALSPVDREGAERIDALGKTEPYETWTICVYLVGSDLEDQNIDELSELMTYQVQKKSEAIQNDKNEKEYARLERFEEELSAKGLSLPEYLYHPVRSISSWSEEYDEEGMGDNGESYVFEGAASADIREMMENGFNDNIKVVIQTGGAKSWTNSMINPNRTQRFLCTENGIELLEDLPLEESFEPSTLAGFLDFCRINYPSDHRMLVLWDHGGGPFGFGVDSIFNRMMTMSEIREALASVYKEDPVNPPFDIIGFDACLMANLDVMHYLKGYARYYALSEEDEPGDGWDYAGLIKAMLDEPTLNPAAVARTVCDTYMDHYMTQNINYQNEEIQLNNVAFSVLDAGKAEELYEAYSELAGLQLEDAASDMTVLSEAGRCAAKSTHYAEAYHGTYNLIDLGNYTDYLSAAYPEECGRIKRLLEETVLYHRANGNLSDSSGVSVYFPRSFDDAYGLIMFLQYIYDISEDDNVRALYYYMIAGCLNDELTWYVRTLTDKVPGTLDPSVFAAFSKLEPVPDKKGFTIPAGKKLMEMITSCGLELGLYDEENGLITYYGNDDFVHPDEEGNIVCDHDGSWIFFDDEPLGVEMISVTDASIEYRSRVLYDGEPAYLVLTCDRESRDITINGIRRIMENYSTGEEYVSDLKKKEPIRNDSTITPVYDALDITTNENCYVEGDGIKVGKDTRVTRKLLPEGYYVTDVMITNQRGERYYSDVMGLDMGGAGLKGFSLDDRFYSRDY